MARNVTYSVSPRINPRDKEAAPKFYGHVQASGDIDIREMSERIQATCTVHKSDVFAVLVALEDFIGTGASGMAQTFSSSGQGVVAVSVGSQSAGTKVTLTDSNGKTLIEYTPELAFSVVILSSKDITTGQNYTVNVGSASGTITAQ